MAKSQPTQNGKPSPSKALKEPNLKEKHRHFICTKGKEKTENYPV